MDIAMAITCLPPPPTHYVHTPSTSKQMSEKELATPHRAKQYRAFSLSLAQSLTGGRDLDEVGTVVLIDMYPI
jgi:hypothetical protein